jgi:colicin import membrane protein
MADPIKDIARRKATTGFTASEARDALVKKEMEAERNAFAVKTAKLRALRLAKEAEDAAQARKLAAEAPPKKSAAAKKNRPRRAE